MHTSEPDYLTKLLFSRQQGNGRSFMKRLRLHMFVIEPSE